MTLLMRCAVILCLVAAASAVVFSPCDLSQWRVPQRVCRHQQPQLNWAEAQRKRKEREHEEYVAREALRAKEKAEREAVAAAKQKAKLDALAAQQREAAEYIDKLDMYRPGGNMRAPSPAFTRDDFTAARGMATSPGIDAERKLTITMKEEVNKLQPSKAVTLLEERLEECRQAGTNVKSPVIKKANILVATLQVAAASEEAQKGVDVDPLKDKFAALFSDEYSFDDDDE